MLTKKEKYINFFTNPPKNYQFVDTFCLYKCQNDKKVSNYDLFGFKTPFVICKTCGLIRASRFMDPKSLTDFYQNHYTKIFSDDYMEPKQFYDFQNKHSGDKWDVISLVKKDFFENDIIMDLGGCSGGVLDRIRNKSKCYLVDYDDKYLEYAKKKKAYQLLKDIENVINEDIKPDLIIMSHVVEHIVDLNHFLKRLKIVMKEKSLVYFEFPAIDSLKLGRSGNFLNELHIPHIYYFTSYWMKDFLVKNGFEILYVDKHSRIIVKLNTANKTTKQKNYFYKTKLDIILGNMWFHSKENTLKRKFVNYINKKFD